MEVKKKNNEMLLESLTTIDVKDCKVLFIGPIEKELSQAIEEYK